MRFVLLLIVLLIILPKDTSAQLSYKFNLESGLLINTIESFNSESTSIYKLFGSVKYKIIQKKSESSIALKIRPELFDNNFNAMKYGAQGNYIYYSKEIIWKSILSYQLFNYSFTDYSSNYSSFTLIGGAEFNIAKTTPAQIFLGYSYQNLNISNTIKSDYLYLDSKIRNTISNYFSFSYGLFIENFSTENRLNNNKNTSTTKGWYYGPQITINYLKNFLLNLDYKFLILSSTNLSRTSFEHRINAYSGIKLNKQISLFLLIDFYFRRTKLRNTGYSSNLLLPTKNENHIYVKANYKLLKHFSIYLKTGYLREELLSENKKLDGMNVLLGVELKN